MRIKAPTVFKLAPYNANWATHDRKSVVQLQTHVHLFHCFIRLFVNKMWQSVDDIEGRKQGQLCCLWSVAGSMLITWQPDRISIFRPGAPYFVKALWGEIRQMGVDHMSTSRQTLTCSTEHTLTMQAPEPEWCTALSFDKMIRKVWLQRRASTPELELKLLHHLWHHLMTLICNLTSWTLPDY